VKEQPTIIKQPLVIMFKDDTGNIICHIHPSNEETHEHYGLLIT